ncbi:MAG TPA: hypothetical protein VGB64_11990 [Actinomycetota bacterium]
MRRPREDGSALVEVAMFVPLAILLLGLGTFVARALIDYAKLSDLSASAARYATRAASDPAREGGYRLRPTAAEVEAYVRRVATIPIESVTVTPDPSTATPGTDVTVAIRARVPLGPVARSVNAIAGLFAGVAGAGPPLPADGITLESATVMREE